VWVNTFAFASVMSVIDRVLAHLSPVVLEEGLEIKEVFNN